MHDDVRMRGFARRTSVADVLRWLDSRLQPLPEEVVPLSEACGRVLARELVGTVNVPPFDRAMMDGLALRAEDTTGATSYNRLPFDVIGRSSPGRPWEGVVGHGQAVRIMTGAPMPRGADAVLPAELVEFGEGRAWAHGSVAAGKHVGPIAEDVSVGSTVLAAGRRLRPQDAGLIASIGVDHVPVVRRPRVACVVTGDELLPAGSPPREWGVFDANGPMLAALVARDGGIVDAAGIVRDDPHALLAALRRPGDVVLVAGGSSVGEEDFVPALVGEHGELAIHGIAMRPSSPTGMGVIDGRLVFLLPGNPVSCLCAYDFFAGRAIRALGGRSPDWPYARWRGPLARKIASQIGRVDYVRVRLVDGQVEPLAIGGASTLSSTVRGDGFVVVDAGSEGHAPGTEVEVFLYG